MTRRYIILLAILFSLCFALAAIVGGLVYIARNDDTPITLNISDDLEFKQFASEEEYNEYVSQTDSNYYGLGSSSISNEFGGDVAMPDIQENIGKDSEISTGFGDGGDTNLDRVSETYTQVAGIDEPDIVKTDGENIFFSNQRLFYSEPIIPFDDFESSAAELPVDNDVVDRITDISDGTKVISAFPPTGLEVTSEISEFGELLLSDEVLMVIDGQVINAFDVSDNTDPEKIWDLAIGYDTYIDNARLYEGELYLFISTYAYSNHPCPIPLIEGANSITIDCTDIYFPTQPTKVDETTTVLKVDPETGNVIDDLSFVSTSYGSDVYMSGDNIYISYQRYNDQNQIYIDFLINESGSILPREVRQDIKRIDGYDISDNSKFNELTIVLEKFYKSLNEEEAAEIDAEFEDSFSTYAKDKIRELQVTDIVRVDSKTLNIKALGSVPGYTLNQFSFDEFEGNLRVATSIADTLTYEEDTNDLYILNKNLDIIGSVKDFGLDESIFGVRFMGDLAYVVTFRQTDPFYVVDLSDPKKPTIAGELKIPGYSSFLHEINDGLVLGVGEENFSAKIALYDVTNPTAPRELDKYIIDGDWTEVANNHNAFLIDPENEIFFIPGGKSGYIFSYDDESIELVIELEDLQARRALYINDYLYVVGDAEIVVLDEVSWEVVGTLGL